MKKEDIKLTKYEKDNYPLPNEESLIILSKIKELEKNNLSKHDGEVVKLIRTQLLDDWETPLIDYLNKLLKKYKNAK